MRRLLIIATLFSFLITFYSCNNSTRLIYKYKNERVKISVLESSNPDPKVNRYAFYVKVDSSTRRFYYVFIPNNVYKVYENIPSRVYSLTFQNKPTISLTNLDKICLDLASIYIDSLGKKNLQFKKGATGFMEEISGH